jgi:hypothetical protein
MAMNDSANVKFNSLVTYQRRPQGGNAIQKSLVTFQETMIAERVCGRRRSRMTGVLRAALALSAASADLAGHPSNSMEGPVFDATPCVTLCGL